MTTDTNKQAALLPCPFCGAGETQIVENGKVWSGMKYSEPTSVSVRHWCQKVEGQPSRMLERIGKDHASAIAAWNQRAAPQGEAVAWQGLTDDEVSEAFDNADPFCTPYEFKVNARSIEAKLREKNTTPQPAAGVDAEWLARREQAAYEAGRASSVQPEPQGDLAELIRKLRAWADWIDYGTPSKECVVYPCDARLAAALLSAAPAVREPLTEEQAEEGRWKWLTEKAAPISAFIAGVRFAEAFHHIGKPKQVGINGLTEAETAASASVMGLTKKHA